MKYIIKKHNDNSYVHICGFPQTDFNTFHPNGTCFLLLNENADGLRYQPTVFKCLGKAQRIVKHLDAIGIILASDVRIVSFNEELQSKFTKVVEA